MLETGTTVAELIAQLQALPPELPVVISGYESGYETAHAPQVATLIHQPDTPYYDGEYPLADSASDTPLEAVVLERRVRNV